MKREQKNALSRQRILEAALCAFSAEGYEGASLNAVWDKNGISKGMLYHYFKDKNEIYLLCVGQCFTALTEYLRSTAQARSGTATQRLGEYFDARLRFFAENPVYLGIFSEAALNPPASIIKEIAECRRAFDAVNIEALTAILRSAPLRAGLSVETIVEDFRVYMDFFNTRFQAQLHNGRTAQEALHEHEQRCHRQLDILLYGVMGESYEDR